MALADEPRALAIPIRGGRIEALVLPGGPGTPLIVIGGVEAGLRLLSGTEHAHVRRWTRRTERRPVIVLGRPIPDDRAVTADLMHPRAMADAVARAIRGLRGLEPPVAIEAESGGGRISLWLTVDHPDLVSRLVLVSVASEPRVASAMTGGMARGLARAERGEGARSSH